MKHKAESFNLDHTMVEAPYIRLASIKSIDLEPGTPYHTSIYKFDLRFTQPNETYMDTDGLHSLEHLIAENIRTYTNCLIDISPMGCRTGFYLSLTEDLEANDVRWTPEKVRALLTCTLLDVLKADYVPGCSIKECGNYLDHDLEKAKEYAKLMLDADKDLLRVFKEESR